MTARLESGDCLDVLLEMAARGEAVDSVVTDPPYHLSSVVKRFGAPGAAPAKFGTDGLYARQSRGFMGKSWDGGDVAFRPETWRLVWDVLKPGGHVAAFGGTRTFHRMAVAIEDAGFEIRDCLMWLYGSGFPKSHDVSKELDKRAGHWRGLAGAKVSGNQAMSGGNYTRTPKGDPVTAAAAWHGWGTALKPAWEPIILARKPLEGTVAANVLAHGTGALNIDGCRVPCDGGSPSAAIREAARNSGKTPGRPGEYRHTLEDRTSPERYTEARAGEMLGRWPANVIHDGSPEVSEAFALYGESASGKDCGQRGRGGIWRASDGTPCGPQYGDSGTAARFFYCAKASAADRAGSKHPTVKPVSLMRYLCRLITPPGGTVLDPFAGSGSTLQAAVEEGFSAIGIEREPEYQADILRRISAVRSVSHSDTSDAELAAMLA